MALVWPSSQQFSNFVKLLRPTQHATLSAAVCLCTASKSAAALTSTSTSAAALLLSGFVSKLLVVTAAMLGCAPAVVALAVMVTMRVSPTGSFSQIQVTPDSSCLQAAAT